VSKGFFPPLNYGLPCGARSGLFALFPVRQPQPQSSHSIARRPFWPTCVSEDT